MCNDLKPSQKPQRGDRMAKRKDFNLSETIREHMKANPKQSAREAFEAISKTAGGKVNEGTFKSTFYKLKGSGKRTVRRRKPMRGASDGAGGVIGTALAFIRAAGGMEQAKQVLSELEAVREL
jgi:hypothetical protein